MEAKSYQDVQSKTLVSWMNYYLDKAGVHINNLKSDFDVSVLATLLEILTGEKVPGFKPNANKMRVQKIENALHCIAFMKKNGVRMYNVSAEDIVDGNITFLLAMTWSLARTYQIARVTTLAEPKPDATVTAVSLEESASYSYNDVNVTESQRDEDDRAKKALLEFVNEVTEEHITDLTKSFKDGRILALLTDKLTSLIEDRAIIELSPLLETVSDEKTTQIDRANKIIAFAEEHLRVPAIISAEDLAAGRVDEKSMMLYISMFKTEYDAYLERKEADEALFVLEQRMSVSFSTATWNAQLPELESKSSKTYETIIRPQMYGSNIPDDPEKVGKMAAAPILLENPPMGGQWHNGTFVMSSSDAVTYNPEVAMEQPDAAPKDRDIQVITDDFTGPKKETWLTKAMSMGKRLVQETQHEITKYYNQKELTKDKGRSYERFRSLFHFQNPEPLYHEFACKFASGQRAIHIGSAYVTKNYFCFTGANGKDALSIVLPMVNISSIELGIAGLIDRFREVPKIVPAASRPGVEANAMLVTDQDSFVHRFYSITDLVTAHQLLNGLWKQAKTHLPPSEIVKVDVHKPPPLPPRPTLIAPDSEPSSADAGPSPARKGSAAPPVSPGRPSGVKKPLPTPPQPQPQPGKEQFMVGTPQNRKGVSSSLVPPKQ